MRRLRKIFATMLGALLFAGFAHADDKILLKVADRYPPDHYIVKSGTEFWMNAVSEATKGRVSFHRYGSEQLGKSKDMVTLTLAGVADVGEIVASYNSDKLPLSTVAELPGAFATSCQGSLAMLQMVRPGGFLFEHEYAPTGLRVIFVLTASPYAIFTHGELHKLADFEGLKLRSSGGGMDMMIRRLGAVPVRLSSAELYEALSRHTVDGAVFPGSSMVTYGLGGFVKAQTAQTGFGSALITYSMSERKWRQLPPDVQEAMLKAGDAATRNVCAASDAGEQTAADALEKGGAARVTFSPEDEAKLDRILAPVAEEWAKSLERSGKPGEATLKAFRAALARHKAK
jgi:TRAP-type C4-dicarboxylate transport system substrate-binding protein